MPAYSIPMSPPPMIASRSGRTVRLHQFRAGRRVPALSEARDVGDDRLGARVDQDLVRAHGEALIALVDSAGVRVDEGGLAGDDRDLLD